MTPREDVLAGVGLSRALLSVSWSCRSSPKARTAGFLSKMGVEQLWSPSRDLRTVQKHISCEPPQTTNHMQRRDSGG